MTDPRQTELASLTERDTFEEWAERDSRRLEPQDYEERLPKNYHYYACESTNNAYIGWCARAQAAPSKSDATGEDEPHRDDRLKPCPFCGCLAWLHNSRKDEWRVECEGSCHAMTCWWHSEQDAIEYWNARPPTPTESREGDAGGPQHSPQGDAGECDCAIPSRKDCPEPKPKGCYYAPSPLEPQEDGELVRRAVAIATDKEFPEPRAVLILELVETIQSLRSEVERGKSEIRRLWERLADKVDVAAILRADNAALRMALEMEEGTSET